MTSTQLEKVITDADQAWHGPGNEPLMNPNMPTDVAAYRVSLEVAYQLAILNEQICGVLQNRVPQIRVMVEPGDWPITVHEIKAL